MAAHKPLSSSSIKRLRATGREQWLTDATGIRGAGRLMLRVTAAGACSWFFRLPRGKGRPQQSIPLGPYSYREQPGALTLSEARTQAAALSATLLVRDLEAPQRVLERLLGAAPPPNRIHSAQDAAAIRTPAPMRVAPPGTPPASQPAHVSSDASGGLQLLQVCRAYVAALRSANKASADKVNYAFERLIAPHPIGQRLARDIASEEFTAFLKEVIRKHGKHTGNDLRNYLSTAYERAVKAETSLDDCEIPVDSGLRWNPLKRVDRAQVQSVRERALQNSELREYWRQLNAPERACELAVRAARLSLLLGGQRCEQLLRVTTVHVDLEAQTVCLFDPKGRRVAPRVHLLPLLPMARAEIEWLLTHCKALGSDLLFASREDCRLNSSTVSAAVHQIYLCMKEAGTAQGHFQFSDIRRTVETLFASQGVPLIVRAHVQSHGLSGMQQKHYDKHDYMKEKREVLKGLEDFLSSTGVVHRASEPPGKPESSTSARHPSPEQLYADALVRRGPQTSPTP